MSHPVVCEPSATLEAFLVDHRLAAPGETSQWRPLTGGVSSEIWEVRLPGRSVCVKRALAVLKVAAEWKAPVSRNAYEWAWMQFAARHCPGHVPEPLAHDPAAGLFAMSYLAPEDHPVWKQQLLEGQVSTVTAQQMGNLLGRLHAASAADPSLRAAFDTTDNFHALRLEPYFVAMATRHPSLADRLRELVSSTADTRRALVHGDVSPKNILVGPGGPVLLDAECAWYGDPAFDLAFCLNHLLLKGLVLPAHRPALQAAIAALVDAYVAHLDWEPAAELEARAARLLPALMLARVDGKSPVEYLGEADRSVVRSFTLPRVATPPATLAEVTLDWQATLAAA